MDFHMSYDCAQENNDENSDEDEEIFIKTQQPVSQSNNTTSPDENVADNLGKKDDHPQSQRSRFGKYSKALTSSTNQLAPIVDSHDLIQNRTYLGDMSNKTNEYDSQAAATQGAIPKYLSLEPINQFLMVNTPASNSVLRPVDYPHDISRKRTYLGVMLHRTNQYSWQAAAAEDGVSKSFSQPITQSLLPESSISNSGIGGTVLKPADDPLHTSQNRTYFANIPRTNLYDRQASVADSLTLKNLLRTPMSQALTVPTSASNSSVGYSVMRPATDPLDTSRNRTYLGAKRYGSQTVVVDGAIANNYSPRPISQSLSVPTSVSNSGSDCSVLRSVCDISPNRTYLGTSQHSVQAKMAYQVNSLVVQTSVANSGVDCRGLTPKKFSSTSISQSLVRTLASDFSAGSNVLKPGNDHHDRSQKRTHLGTNDDSVPAEAHHMMYENASPLLKVLTSVSNSNAGGSGTGIAYDDLSQNSASLSGRNPNAWQVAAAAYSAMHQNPSSMPVSQSQRVQMSTFHYGADSSILTPANNSLGLLQNLAHLHDVAHKTNQYSEQAKTAYHAKYDNVSPTLISQSLMVPASASNSGVNCSSLTPNSFSSTSISITVPTSASNSGAGYSVVRPAEDSHVMSLNQSYLGPNQQSVLPEVTDNAMYDNVLPTSTFQSPMVPTSASNSGADYNYFTAKNFSTTPISQPLTVPISVSNLGTGGSVLIPANDQNDLSQNRMNSSDIIKLLKPSLIEAAAASCMLHEKFSPSPISQPLIAQTSFLSSDAVSSVLTPADDQQNLNQNRTRLGDITNKFNLYLIRTVMTCDEILDNLSSTSISQPLVVQTSASKSDFSGSILTPANDQHSLRTNISDLNSKLSQYLMQAASTFRVMLDNLRQTPMVQESIGADGSFLTPANDRHDPYQNRTNSELSEYLKQTASSFGTLYDYLSSTSIFQPFVGRTSASNSDAGGRVFLAPANDQHDLRQNQTNLGDVIKILKQYIKEAASTYGALFDNLSSPSISQPTSAFNFGAGSSGLTPSEEQHNISLSRMNLEFNQYLKQGVAICDSILDNLLSASISHSDASGSILTPANDQHDLNQNRKNSKLNQYVTQAASTFRAMLENLSQTLIYRAVMEPTSAFNSGVGNSILTPADDQQNLSKNRIIRSYVINWIKQYIMQIASIYGEILDKHSSTSISQPLMGQTSASNGTKLEFRQYLMQAMATCDAILDKYPPTSISQPVIRQTSTSNYNVGGSILTLPNDQRDISKTRTSYSDLTKKLSQYLRHALSMLPALRDNFSRTSISQLPMVETSASNSSASGNSSALSVDSQTFGRHSSYAEATEITATLNKDRSPTSVPNSGVSNSALIPFVKPPSLRRRPSYLGGMWNWRNVYNYHAAAAIDATHDHSSPPISFSLKLPQSVSKSDGDNSILTTALDLKIHGRSSTPVIDATNDKSPTPVSISAADGSALVPSVKPRTCSLYPSWGRTTEAAGYIASRQQLSFPLNNWTLFTPSEPLKCDPNPNLDTPSASRTYSYFVTLDNQKFPVPSQLHNDRRGSGLPRRAKYIHIISNHEPVCALTFSKSPGIVYTGGGSVKVWDFNNCRTIAVRPKLKLDCFQSGNFIRSLKITPDDRTLIVGGESRRISLWDLKTPTPQQKATLRFGDSACLGLTVSPDSKILYSCSSAGNIGMWDLHNQLLIRQVQGHTEEVTCIDISSCGNTIWTGSKDQTVRTWDLRNQRHRLEHCFNSKVYSLRACPTGCTLTVGLENSYMEVMHPQRPGNFRVHLHKDAVLSMKYAPSGRWVLSTGRDNLWYIWRPPIGTCLHQHMESADVVCCDISPDLKFIVTGSIDKHARVYEVYYN